jgi:hypothetical protein
MPYKVSINTESYKPMRCSDKNWEAGTINDYMEALNGWSARLKNLKEVRWQIEMFHGRSHREEEVWDYESNSYKPEYIAWRNKKNNTITYMDKLCGFKRTSPIKVYGFAQGYFDIDKVIERLRKEGVVRIPFSWFYDVRQYNKNMDGCYIEISKC